MSNVIDIRRKKPSQEDDKPKLYVDHSTGKIRGSPHLKTPEINDDFGDRMTRIRQSLEKINQLMADLKNSSKNRDFHD